MLQSLDKIDKINYLRANVETYFPGIVEALGSNVLDWNDLNDLLENEHAVRVQRFKAEGLEAITVEATIYDVIVEFKKKDKRAINLLDYFNKLMYELSQHLDAKEQKLIVSNIRNVLVSLDMKYLNFIGEMAVLNSLVKSKLYKLINVEERLSNNKSLDFKFVRTSDHRIQLVEIMNIHLDDEKVTTDEGLIRKFMDGRLTKKIADKKSKLENDITFFLVPVLWGNAESLKIYSDYFSKNEMHIDNVTEPVAYVTFSDENDATFLMHRFGRISNLFKT